MRELVVMERAVASRSAEEHVFQKSRQAGKNQQVGLFQARQLVRLSLQGGSIVHTAPAFSPQMDQIAMPRLEDILQSSPLTAGAYRKSGGAAFHLGRMRVLFLSGKPESKKEGATAETALMVDEAHDFDTLTFNRSFGPMRLVAAAPTFYFGAAWDTDNLLEHTKVRLLEKGQQEGNRFKYVHLTPWYERAEHNPTYGRACEAERDRLGEDHPVWLSQYCLIPVESVGRMFTLADLDLLHGRHPRLRQPRAGEVYVAGIDYCGAGENPEEAVRDPDYGERRDSTVVTIAACVWSLQRAGSAAGIMVPSLRVVDHLCLPGMHPDTTHKRVCDYLRRWGVVSIAGDGRGVGDGPAHRVQSEFGETVCEVIKSEESEIGFSLQGAVKSGRFRIYQETDGDEDAAECYLQFQHLQRQLLPSGRMRWSAPSKKQPINGVKRTIHDDYPKSGGYALRAAERHMHGPDTSGSWWTKELPQQDAQDAWA